MGISLGVNIDDGFSRGILQGAYIAQMQVNRDPRLAGGKKLRLLIARSGSNIDKDKATANLQDVAHQVVRAAQFDKTIVGVQGWTNSETTANAIKILEDAHLPIVAPNATSDNFTSISPYFFRVLASNKAHATLIAPYIERQLKAQRLVIFRDLGETYSSTLSEALLEQFAKDRYRTASVQDFQTANKDGLLAQKVQNALTAYNPDLLYIITNTVGDVTTLLNSIPDGYPDLKVFTGGAGYRLVQADTKPNGYGRLLLSVTAFPDEWKIAELSQGRSEPPFFEDYRATYDPYKLHRDDNHHPYTYSRADYVVMLSYDAMYAFLVGSKGTILQGKQSPTPEDMRNALAQIDSSQPFQGISGAVSFGPDGNPINKMRLILRVADGQFLHLAGYQGCFLIDQICDDSIPHLLE